MWGMYIYIYIILISNMYCYGLHLDNFKETFPWLHVGQAVTKLLVSSLIVGLQNRLWRNSRAWIVPGWQVRREKWPHWRTWEWTDFGINKQLVGPPPGSGSRTWAYLMALFHCMVRHGTVRYGSLLGGFPLGTVPGTWYFFSTTSVEVPCEPYRYQNVTCKLCWSLIGLGKSSLLRHWTCDTRPSSTVIPARFKSAQPAKDRTQLLFKQTHIFASTTK